MALPRGELSTLLRDLRAAGPVDRVRLLARSLSSLRRLSPWDRKILLRMAGFEGAEALVERLAQEDEGTASRLRRVLGELEERPDELERTIRDLADPNRRGQAVDELLATLDRGTGAEGSEPEEAPEARPVETGPGPVPEAPPVPPPGAGSAPLPEPPPVPEREVPLAAPPPAPEGRQSVGQAFGPPSAGGTPALQDAAPPLEEPETPPEPESEMVPESEPEARPQPRLSPAPPRPSPAPTPASPAEPPGGPRASAVAVLERLLDLRRRVGGEPPLAADLARTLEREIPFPWARRRALQAWIEAGGAADLDDALALIGELPAAADRTWCLGTLAQRGPWDDGDWQRIVEAAPTPAARRRLDRRRKAL